MGLGAEHLPAVKKQSERTRLQLKIRNKILKAKRRKKESLTQEQQEAIGGSHDDQCSDNDTSRADSVSSRKRPLADTVDTRPFKRRQRKISHAKKKNFLH